MRRHVFRRRSLYNAAICFGLFLAAAGLRRWPGVIDYPVFRGISGVSANSPALTALADGVAYPAVQGVGVVSLVWYCWFSRPDREERIRIIGGILAAVSAGFLAYLLHRLLPSVPRPVSDPILRSGSLHLFGSGSVSAAPLFSGSSSFPSERATMFGGLAFALLVVDRRIGRLALGGTLGVEACRIWLGLHYPTDIAASVFLGGACVWFAQAGLNPALACRSLRLPQLSPATFYACAFVLSYLLASAFRDIRVFLD